MQVPGMSSPTSQGSSGAPKLAVLPNINQTEQCKKVHLSSQLTWTVIPNGTHQSGVWSQSLGAPQPCPWESDSSHSATDRGCMPVCPTSPSHSRITAAAAGAAQPWLLHRAGTPGGCSARPLSLPVGSEEQSWHKLQQPEHQGAEQPPHTACRSQSS